MLYALDLFSGIGGNSIGLKDYVRTVAYCEADRHAQAVLLSRMSDGSLPAAPICTDVSRLDGYAFRGKVDIIIAGFPCQDISVAGKGAGLEGKRSGLFYEVVRLAKEVKPTFLFLENVPAIRTRGLDRVIEELTEAGYDCRWTMLSAAEVGAPHKRERWFLLGYSSSGRCMQSGEREMEQSGGAETLSPSEALANSNEKQPHRGGTRTKQDWSGQSTNCGWWTAEPDVGRVANGVPLRVDRLKRLGNAVVPAQAKEAFEILIGLKNG